MTPEEAFGLVLKTIRSDAKISQEKLAFSCGLDRTYISLLERGRRQPSLSTIFKVSSALGVDACVLFSRVYKTYIGPEEGGRGK